MTWNFYNFNLIGRERKKRPEKPKRFSRSHSRTPSPPPFRGRNTAMDAQEALARRYLAFLCLEFFLTFVNFVSFVTDQKLAALVAGQLSSSFLLKLLIAFVKYVFFVKLLDLSFHY